MNKSGQAQMITFGLLGGAVGGFLGYFAFFWMARQGFYALILPPALLGLAAGLCARGRSVLLACICAVAGLALCMFVEWQFAPFVADKSFKYFIGHLQSLKPATLLMMALGVFFSFRLALGFNTTRRTEPNA